MTSTAIKARSLGKQYRVGYLRSSDQLLRDALVRAAKLQLFRGSGNGSRREKFWALRDVSFEMKHGEAVGIIGHNGAGKSTLLKVLSRITEPTTGSADVYGRVGSLLEVGTGFHQELTGRENIYLSGAIMGMKRNDIKLRFDEIVAFAGVERFVDTPIKHYSSGMYLRLAFAVAAHLEPDILLVDEVLAVGDLEFQKKCLTKMESVATEGRTVLFVSHNMGSMRELCRRGLVLKNGRVDFDGSISSAIGHYSQQIAGTHATDHDESSQRGWTGLKVLNVVESRPIRNTEPFEIEAKLFIPNTLTHTGIHCYLEDADGLQVVHNREPGLNRIEKGTYTVRATVPPLYLKPGVYTLFLKLVGEADDAVLLRYFSERLLVDIADGTRLFNGKVRAILLPPVQWSLESNRVSEFVHTARAEFIH